MKKRLTKSSQAGVQVRLGYRGKRTDEQFIEPGFYTTDDPALYGLGSYLVDAGFADLVLIHETKTPLTPKEAKEEAESLALLDLESLDLEPDESLVEG